WPPRCRKSRTALLSGHACASACRHSTEGILARSWKTEAAGLWPMAPNYDCNLMVAVVARRSAGERTPFCSPRPASRLCLFLAPRADRHGAWSIEQELLALSRYALTGRPPFALAHMRLRIPVAQARRQPLCGAPLDRLNILNRLDCR